MAGKVISKPDYSLKEGFWKYSFLGRHDTQHNDINHNDIQHNNKKIRHSA